MDYHVKVIVRLAGFHMRIFLRVCENEPPNDLIFRKELIALHFSKSLLSFNPDDVKETSSLRSTENASLPCGFGKASVADSLKGDAEVISNALQLLD